MAKTAHTMRLLARAAASPRFYLLTGAVMREAAQRLLGVRPVRFRPQHKSKLSNEFLLYTNVEPSTRVGGWDVD